MTQPPPHFKVIGRTTNCANVAMQHHERPIYALQFHPEVKDSVQGTQILANFLQQCDVEPSWSMESFIQETLQDLQDRVGDHKVLMFLSGGVDSSVAFALLNEALGPERVLGLFIDNGFLRKNEATTILDRYHQLGFHNIRFYDAREDFLQTIAHQVDPQEKRHRVGAMFVKIRDRFLQELQLEPDEWLLGQGTLYPDIIESGGSEHAHVIKSHHNRVQEVETLIRAGKVVEPLKDLYKDEVRTVGKILGLPDSIVRRHPFPGPGLSINVLCAHGDEKFPETERLRTELQNLALCFGYQADLLAVRSVGVQGDRRSYRQPAVLIGPQDWEKLEAVAIRITNAIREINRVVTLVAPQALPPLAVQKAYCDRERLALLQEADALATQTLEQHQLMAEIFQLLVISLPLAVNTCGHSIVLRPVCSEDVMTAQFAKIPWQVLHPLAHKILQLPGVAAVFYDITHKPPATFGWE